MAMTALACKSERWKQAPEPDRGVPTVVVMPDTQGYALRRPELFHAQTQWIADNARRLDIRFVLHVGDITETGTAREWQVARDSFARLAQGDEGVPFALVPGNHDYHLDAERSSRLSEFFPPRAMHEAPTFGGLWQAGSSDNSYHVFDMVGDRWLVLALEWGPRDAVLDWGNQVLLRHADHRAIILTHAHLYLDGTRYHWAARGKAQKWSPHKYDGSVFWPQLNDGQEVWDKLAARHRNVELVVSGHIAEAGVARNQDQGVHGNLVHELTANFQAASNHGDGYLRVMQFHPRRIAVWTYSPGLDRYLRGDAHQFVVARR